jgi:hypothetical protein
MPEIHDTPSWLWPDTAAKASIRYVAHARALDSHQPDLRRQGSLCPTAPEVNIRRRNGPPIRFGLCCTDHKRRLGKGRTGNCVSPSFELPNCFNGYPIAFNKEVLMTTRPEVLNDFIHVARRLFASDRLPLEGRKIAEQVFARLDEPSDDGQRVRMRSDASPFLALWCLLV